MGAAPYLLYSKAVFLTELMNVCVSFIDLIIVIDFPTICIQVHRFYECVIGKEAVHAE